MKGHRDECDRAVVQAGEAVEISLSSGVRDELYTKFYDCPSKCGAQMIHGGAKYCYECGRSIRWVP